MRTRSTNPPNAKSDTAKQLTPKKVATKPLTKPGSTDPVTESASATNEAKTYRTPTFNVPKTDEQTKQNLKDSTSIPEADAKTQAEVAREMKGNPGASKLVKKVTPGVKTGSAMETKFGITPRAKTADASKLSATDKFVTNSSAKVNNSSEKEEATKVVPGELKEATTDEIVEKGEQNEVEPMENEEFGGEEYEEEEEPEDVDQEGEEMEDYGDGEGYEEAEVEEGDDEAAGEEEGDEEHNEMEVPDAVQERSRKKELEVFVGGLDKDATEEDLRKVFSQVGEVVEVRLPKNPGTNKNKGYAFIGFATNEQAKHAVTELKNPTIRGKRCGLAPSEDNDTLFLGNICKTWTKEAVKGKLKDYGIEGLEELTLVGDTQNEGISRGFAFIAFSTHMDAMNAYKRLQRPDVIFGADRTAKVAFAEPLREPDEEIMAQVKSVFVDGIPPYWDEDRVKEYLKPYGEIERVVLARNMPTAKRRDFGFVNFTSHEAAMSCIEGLNNTMLIDGETKLKVRVRLANPLPKSQAVKGGMRGGFPIGRSGIGIRTRQVDWGLQAGRYPMKKVGMPRGRGFIPRWRGRGFVGRGGRFLSRDDDDVDTLFHAFREQLVRDERRPGRAPRHIAGGPRRGSYRDYSRQKNAFYSRPAAPTRRGGDFTNRTAGTRPVTYKDGYGPKRGNLLRGGARPLQSRRHSFPPAEDTYIGRLDRELEHSRMRQDSYAYDIIGHGTKRPYATLDENPRYGESGSRGHARTRYNYSEPVTSGTRYPSQQTVPSTYDRLAPDPIGTGTGLYSSIYPSRSDYYNTDLGGSSYSSSLYGGSRTLGGGSYY
eukprot:PITA_00554